MVPDDRICQNHLWPRRSCDEVGERSSLPANSRQAAFVRAMMTPDDRPQPYAVYVDDTDAVWVSDWGANAILRFDPKTERFESFPLPDSHANVRQLASRKGDHLDQPARGLLSTRPAPTPLPSPGTLLHWLGRLGEAPALVFGTEVGRLGCDKLVSRLFTTKRDAGIGSVTSPILASSYSGVAIPPEHDHWAGVVRHKTTAQIRQRMPRAALEQVRLRAQSGTSSSVPPSDISSPRPEATQSLRTP